MSNAAPLSARARARTEITEEIKSAARARLASDGAPGLSMRAVSRDLGMVSSALYRYFRSRDELLTALIVDAYDSLGEHAEKASAKAISAGANPPERWLAVCRAVRSWARRHPHEFALIYGSPIPGYAAPALTIEPATRVVRLMASAVNDAATEGLLESIPRHLPPPSVVSSAVTELVAVAMLDEGADIAERSILLWIALIGTITFELYGHLNNVVTDYGKYFDRAMAVSAEAVGLVLPLR